MVITTTLLMPNGGRQIHHMQIKAWHVNGYVGVRCLDHGGCNAPMIDRGAYKQIALSGARECYRIRKLAFWTDKPTERDDEGEPNEVDS